jgi:hypothetical protein
MDLVMFRHMLRWRQSPLYLAPQCASPFL